MPLTAADITFFAAEKNTDNADGGGARSGAVVQTGALHTLFPPVAAADRLTGRVRLRKLYPSLTNTDATALLGASVCVNELPGDSATSVALFAFGDAKTTRAQALAAFKAGTRMLTDELGNPSTSSTAASAVLPITSGVDVDDLLLLSTTDLAPMTHQTFAGSVFVSGAPRPNGGAMLAHVIARSPGVNVTLSQPVPSASYQIYKPMSEQPAPVRAYAPVTTRSNTANGSATAQLTSVFVQVAARAAAAPLGVGQIDGFGNLVDDSPLASNAPPAQYNLASSAGNKRAVYQGDAVTLYHEAAMAPATLAPGTVSTGRTALEQITVRGDNGLDIATFVRNGPAPAGVGCTADLDAGTLTITSVTGWSQPVTVLHRIAHRAAVDAIAGATATLSIAVTRDFPAGSVLTPHLPLSDVVARVSAQFTQQAWTKVWSDGIIGNPASSVYGGAIAVANAGAETDRWAVVFSDAASFTVYSEQLGLVGSGTTASDFSPLNPDTNAAFFTLAASAWAPGIPVGTTLRFNIEGACPPVWVLQSIAPSAPSAATTRAVVRLHGSV